MLCSASLYLPPLCHFFAFWFISLHPNLFVHQIQTKGPIKKTKIEMLSKALLLLTFFILALSAHALPKNIPRIHRHPFKVEAIGTVGEENIKNFESSEVDIEDVEVAEAKELSGEPEVKRLVDDSMKSYEFGNPNNIPDKYMRFKSVY
ncbi:hypothetical protein L873DRAFT_207915 [Choiromyces venosus 120613-1]|uniref:Uncharacterized protein n=1 Tax=Choiromyces venosus 120613-1 TaxID=1336337 RepID=A0A3N4J1S0_9PEZI|nr:hypothetical protein L873DRAFT_207915 [Choiromyces venosus 120613-1]